MDSIAHGIAKSQTQLSFHITQLQEVEELYNICITPLGENYHKLLCTFLQTWLMYLFPLLIFLCLFCILS